MAEFRQDVLTGRWVLISPERQRRKGSPRVRRARARRGRFEPKMITSFDVTGASERVEIHKHLYPPLQALTAKAKMAGAKRTIPGKGVSVLILFASQKALENTDYHERNAFAEAYVWLLDKYRRDKRLKAFSLFRNAGSGAGASVRLPHHQFWGLPVPTAEDELERAWAAQQKTCPTCQLAEVGNMYEVTSNRHAALFVRPAARFGGELLVLPKRHVKTFRQLTKPEKSSVLELVATGERRIQKYFPGVSFNEIWHDWQPKDNNLHMRVEILPRVNFMGGLEVGEAVHVNPYKPEAVRRDLVNLTHINAL